MNAPTAYSYQWQRCNASGANCTSIPGATANGLTLTATDPGTTLRVLVTAANAGGATTQSSSASAVILPLAPALAAAPQVAGTPTNTDTLTVGAGSWSNQPTSYTYAWEDCDGGGAACTKIAGATSSSYTLQIGDVGDTIRALVTAVNAGGSTTVSTGPTAVIAPALIAWANQAPPAVLSAPAVAGTPAPGATLTCLTGTWSGAPTAFAYQWNRGTRPIAGATAASYAVTAADLGSALDCTVVASNAGGAIEADSASVAVAAGPSASSSGTVPGCPAPSGSLTAGRLGALRLGDSRAQALAAVRRRAAGAGAVDSFCLAGGPGLTVDYAAASRSASIARAGGRAAARVAVVLTANPYYALRGLHPGARIAGHRLGRGVRIRATVWFVVTLRGADGLVAVRRGVVAEVGVAARSVAGSRAALRGVLARFSA